MGVVSRIIRSVEQESGYLLMIKGVARVRIARVEVKGSSLSAKVAKCVEEEAKLNVDDLRDFAELDPLIEGAAGSSAIATVRSLPAGKLCDFIITHGDNAEAVASVLEAVSVVDRVGLVRQHFSHMLSPQ